MPRIHGFDVTRHMPETRTVTGSVMSLVLSSRCQPLWPSTQQQNSLLGFASVSTSVYITVLCGTTVGTEVAPVQEAVVRCPGLGLGREQGQADLRGLDLDLATL